MKKAKTIDFLEGKSSRNLMALFVPLLIAFFFSMAFDINDSLWIGNLLGEKALAAQTVSMPLILIYNAVCMGVTGGIAILLAQAVGAKQESEIGKLISTSFTALLIFSFVITLFCEAGINLILSAINTPAEIYLMAKNFLMIHILSFPFVMLYMYFCAVLRSYGNSTVQLAAIIGCTLLNVGLDPLFIHFMGMSGVALATVISEGAMMVLLFFYCKKNRIMHIDLRLFRWDTLCDIASKAVPSMIQQSLPSISAAFVTSLVAVFGVTSIAAYGIAAKIETLLLYPPMAMNMALTSATGQCFGAKSTIRARDYSKWGVLIGCGLLSVLTLGVVLFSKQFTALFGADNNVSKIVSSYFYIIAFGYVCNIVTNSMLGTINGAGKPATAMFLMIFYYIIVRMPLAKILSLTVLGINGIWVAVLISHVAATIASTVLCRLVYKRKAKDGSKAVSPAL